MLGEIHGVAQTPVLLEELIAWFGLGSIALEWHEDLMPWLEGWIAYGTFPELDEEQNPAVAQIWGGDGRLTAGHLAALRRWVGNGLLITLMDGMTIPMGAHLARQRPGLCSIECVYGSGSFYNLGPRRHFDRLPEH